MSFYSNHSKVHCQDYHQLGRELIEWRSRKNHANHILTPWLCQDNSPISAADFIFFFDAGEGHANDVSYKRLDYALQCSPVLCIFRKKSFAMDKFCRTNERFFLYGSIEYHKIEYLGGVGFPVLSCYRYRGQLVFVREYLLKGVERCTL